MKKLVLALSILAIIAQAAHSQENTDSAEQQKFLLLSGFAGISAQAGSKDEQTNRLGFNYGGSLRYIYDDPEYPTVAAGLTYFSSVFKDDGAKPGDAKIRTSGTTADLLVALRRTYRYITYLAFMVGTARETFNSTTSTGSTNTTVTSTTYGIGFGAFEKPTEKKRVIIGTEMRYLRTPEFQDMSGIFQLIVSIGYAF